MWQLVARAGVWLLNVVGAASFGWSASDWFNESQTTKQTENKQDPETAEQQKKRQMWRTIGLLGGIFLSIVAFFIGKRILKNK